MTPQTEFETVESIFQDVASMRQSERKDEDPYQSEEYARFVEGMIPHCRCSERYRPCDGVLAGGLCDGLSDERDDLDYRGDNNDY